MPLSPPQETPSVSTDESLKSQLDFERTWIDLMARTLTSGLGSVYFLASTIIFIALWILLNLGVLGIAPFDPRPFGWLAILVSIVAMFLSIIVLINQNRQGKIAEIRQQIDFEINVRAEQGVSKVLEMIDAIHREMGIAKGDQELERMKEVSNIGEIKQEIEQVIQKENEKLG